MCFSLCSWTTLFLFGLSCFTLLLQDFCWRKVQKQMGGARDGLFWMRKLARLVCVLQPMCWGLMILETLTVLLQIILSHWWIFHVFKIVYLLWQYGWFWKSCEILFCALLNVCASSTQSFTPPWKCFFVNNQNKSLWLIKLIIL